MGQVSTTLRIVDKGSKTLDSIFKKLNQVNSGFQKMATQSQKVSSAVTSATSANNKFGKSLNTTNTLMKRSSNSASLLTSKLKALASAYLGVMGAKALLTTSDTLTSADNKFQSFARNQGIADPAAFSAEAQEKIFNAAQAAYGDYSQMMSNVAKSITLASDAFGDTSEQQTDNAIKFQEIMAKTYTLGGASAAEQSSSMYQLVQALGSGNLSGDELRSVREGAPLAYQAIEEFAQGVLHSEESLKDLGSQGLITSDIVVGAILDMEGQVDESFQHINLTWAQLWTRFKNDAVMAFKPFLAQLREIANSDEFATILEGITNAVRALGNAFTYLGQGIEYVVGWIADNMDWLSNAIAVAVGVGIGLLAAFAVAWVMTNWPILLVIAAIAGVSYVLTEMGFTANEVLGGIIGGLMWVAIVIYDALIIAISAIASAFIFVGTIVLLVVQGIVQLILWIVTTVKAVAVTIYNIIYTLVVGAWAAIKTFVGQVAQGFIDMGVTILKVIQKIAEAIDFVFGSNLASTIGGWMKGLQSLSTNMLATLDVKGDLNSIKDQWTSSYSDLADQYAGRGKYDDWNITDNMADTWKSGTGLIDSIGDIAGGLLKNPNDSFKAGYNFGSSIVDGLSEFNIDDVFAKVDSTGFNYGGIGDDVGKIGKDTGKIAKSMDVAEEDLELLRDIAERETINRFTTAEIKVEMTNNNNVSDGSDLDGIVTHLGTRLRQELAEVANGVHIA